MAWIDTVSPEDAQGDLKKVYTQIRKKRGSIGHIYQIQSLDPPGLLHHTKLYRHLLFSRSPLSRFQRELIGVVVSQVNQCHY